MSSRATTRRVQPTVPFSFRQAVAFLDGFAPCAGDHACRTSDRVPDELVTGGYAGGAPFVARLRDDGDALALDVQWVDEADGGDGASAGDPAAVEAWLRAFLSLDDDLTGLYDAARDDPAFSRVVEALHGLHHVRFPTAFEAACWAALSQRTPMAVARSRKRALVEAAGRVAHVDGERVALFPTPERVLANETAVRDAVGDERKARTVLAAAEAFASEDLAALDDDALRARLADVWGFGPWSSEFVALRGFGRMAALPRTERRLYGAVGDLYGLDGPATDADLDRLSARYEPLAGYWAHYVRVWHYRERGL